MVANTRDSMDIEITRRQVLTVGAAGMGLAVATSPARAAMNVAVNPTTPSATTSYKTADIDIEGNSYVEYSWTGFDSVPEPDFYFDVRGTSNGWTPSDSTASNEFTSFQHELVSGDYIIDTTYSGLNSTSGERSTANGNELLFSNLFSGETFPVAVVPRHDGFSGDYFVPSENGDGASRTIELEYYLRAVTNEGAGDSDSANDGEKTLQTMTVTYDSPIIEGVVYYNGSRQNDATVYAIPADATAGDSVVSTTTTTINSSDGRFRFTGLQPAVDYHLLVQYNDGGTIVTDYSSPYILPPYSTP